MVAKRYGGNVGKKPKATRCVVGRCCAPCKRSEWWKLAIWSPSTTKGGGDKRDCKRRAVHRPFAMVLLRWAPKTFGLGCDKGLCAPNAWCANKSPKRKTKRRTRVSRVRVLLGYFVLLARRAKHSRQGEGLGVRRGAGSAARLGHQLGQGGGLVQRRQREKQPHGLLFECRLE